MSPLLTILATTLLGVAWAAPKGSKNQHCQEFSRGVRFEENQVSGTWTLLRLKTESTNTADNSHCVDFVPVCAKERQDLEDSIGKYVENLEWKNLSLKMLIPCASSNSSRTATYYLERLDSDGSYRTLQMPPATAKLDLSSFHRYSVRLKLLQGRYLGMLDCLDRVAFLMGRQPETDPRLETLIDGFWPRGDHTQI